MSVADATIFFWKLTLGNVHNTEPHVRGVVRTSANI